MTNTTATIRVQYNGDGSVASFSIPYVIWDDDDVLVIHRDSSGTETTWTKGTQYTITLSGTAPATATLAVSTSPTDYTPASGEKLTLISNLADTQPTKLPTGGDIPSATLEQMVDKAVRGVQQHSEEIGRSIKFAKTSTYSDVEIPDPVAGKIIRWNSAATALENVDAGTSLTTPLGIADGGTGGTSAATALSNLGIKLSAQRISLWKLGQF